MGLTDQYSSVTINQNAAATDSYAWRNAGGHWLYQTFVFPGDYQRGFNASEQRIPDLSGFQVFVTIDSGYAATAALDYIIQYFTDDLDGWKTITAGTIIGAATDGPGWFDIIPPQSIPIPKINLTIPYRLGLSTRTASGLPTNIPVTINPDGTYTVGSQTYTATLTNGVPYPITFNGAPGFLLRQDGRVTASPQEGISGVSYVSPTPLMTTMVGPGQVYQSDGLTPLLGGGTTAALNFRVLSLAADSGTDFLNNAYRSMVVFTSPANTSTTGGVTPIQGAGSGAYYMSPPLPSPFAVESLYWDVRPVPTSPQYGTVNTIGNPSFEYDVVGQPPQWWSAFINGGTVVDQTVYSNEVDSSNPHYTSWTYDRLQALHMEYTFTAPNQQLGIISDYDVLPSTTGGSATPLSVSLAYDILTATDSSLFFSLLFYDAGQNLISSQSFDPATTGSGVFQQATSAPGNAAYVRYLVSALSTSSGSFEAYVDAIQTTLTPAPVPYFDGDDVNCQWLGERGQSASTQLVEANPQDDAVVIDGIFIDPLTPNMIVNVYYSVDDAYTSANMTESDWEQKLWYHIPRTIICSHRHQYVFPRPVLAKYVKVEFTNPQARSYDPGPLAKPVAYKKFPTWVASYFLAQLLVPSFVGSQVNVEQDALTFAYSYYLDDLHEGPKFPTVPPTTIISQLSQYFAPGHATTGVDPTTLAQINLNMSAYQVPVSTTADLSSTLGSFVTNLVNTSTNASPTTTLVEGGLVQPLDLTNVSSLNRDAVVLEQSMPDMYFFLPCRHTYKELLSSFEYNRAYFIGVKDIAFIRHNYAVPTDTPLYIESGGDNFNTEFNNWQIDTDLNWYTY